MPINNQDIQDFNDLKDLYFSKQDWDIEVYAQFYRDFNNFKYTINYIENIEKFKTEIKTDWKIQNILDSFKDIHYSCNNIFVTNDCSIVTINRLLKVKDVTVFEFLFSEFSGQNYSKANSINKLQFFDNLSKINLEDFETLCFTIGIKHSVDLKIRKNIDYLYELYPIGRGYLYKFFREHVWFWIELEIKKFLNGKQKVERFLQEYKHTTQNFREIDLNQSIENYVKVKNQNRVEENVLTRDIGNFLSNQGFRDLGLIFEGKATPVAKGHGRCDIISQNYDFIIESKYYKGVNLVDESKGAVNQGVKYCKEHSIKNLYVIIFLSDKGNFESLIEESGNVDSVNFMVHCVDIRLDKNPPSQKLKRLKP
jgi:hypothetical protein